METPPGHEFPSMDIKQSTHLRPDLKTQRYDRQLRLWGAGGNNKLEQAHVLLVNGNATGTAILKNLVLPGLGQFTILDASKVTGDDLGNNFFLDPEETKIGDSRAEQAEIYLAEMNEDVTAHSQGQTVSAFLNSSSDPLSPFTLIIVVDTPPEETLLLSDRAWDAGIPLIAVKSAGFIGQTRTQMQEAHFIETHPDGDATLDLRLDVPFRTLTSHAATITLTSLDSHEYAHVPPIVILLQALERFKASHDGNLPSKYAEKNELKKVIRGMKRGGVNADEENFEEAVGMVMKSVKKTEIPKYLNTLFEDQACDNLSSQSAPFWILLRAVRDFVRSPETNAGHALLPLVGSLPDMKATSSGYATLTSLYRNKSKEDLSAVRSILDGLLTSLDLPKCGESGSPVNDESLQVFVKNVAFCKLIRGRKMRDEYERPDKTAISRALRSATSIPAGADDDEEASPTTLPIHWYLALRAADTFHVEHSRWPGDIEGDSAAELEKDLEELVSEQARKVLETCTGLQGEDAEVGEALERALSEIVRAPPATTMPQISALLGGIVAQEAIKIITKQYIPLNGTSIFDGIKSVSESFTF